MSTEIDKLIEILGTESGNAWLNFMDYTHEILADVIASKGKPTQETISESIIGQAGFTSWKGMVETSVSSGGLGWNISAWNQWKRAYRVVKRHPYLRDVEVTPSQINTLWNELKEEFPTDLEGFEACQLKRKADIEERQANSLANAKARISELEELVRQKDQSITLLTTTMETLKEANDSLEAKLTTSTQSITDLTSQNAVLDAKSVKQAETITDLEKQLREANSSLKSVKKDKTNAITAKDKLERDIRNFEKLPIWKRLFTKSVAKSK